MSSAFQTRSHSQPSQLVHLPSHLPYRTRLETELPKSGTWKRQDRPLSHRIHGHVREDSQLRTHRLRQSHHQEGDDAFLPSTEPHTRRFPLPQQTNHQFLRSHHKEPLVARYHLVGTRRQTASHGFTPSSRTHVRKITCSSESSNYL